MEQKAQGAIEYLLIIGAAILVVAIVIIAVTSVLGQGKTQTTGGAADQNTAIFKLNCMNDCNSLDTNCLKPTSCSQFADICKSQLVCAKN